MTEFRHCLNPSEILEMLKLEFATRCRKQSNHKTLIICNGRENRETNKTENWYNTRTIYEESNKRYIFFYIFNLILVKLI